MHVSSTFVMHNFQKFSKKNIVLSIYSNCLILILYIIVTDVERKIPLVQTNEKILLSSKVKLLLKVIYNFTIM